MSPYIGERANLQDDTLGSAEKPQSFLDGLYLGADFSPI
jgi:hypothetical protein